MAEPEKVTPPGPGSDQPAATTPREAEPSAEPLAKELAATKDRLLRALADQENSRVQARRERDQAVRYAAGDFAGDLLSSVDNLERAIASVPEDQRSAPAVASLLAGVEATRRAILGVFAKHGLKRLDPIGERFDPHRHDASFQAVDTRYPPGTVTSVIQPGYMHHDRLLRPALVAVGKAAEPPPAKTDAP